VSLTTALARALRDSGLQWHPAAGDAFVIDRVEADDQVFILSDMTIEAHHYPSGTVLGFNGTTEWALDSVSMDDALWLPSEAQLRELLGPAFRSLTAGYTVEAVIDGQVERFEADAAADAYARALLRRLDSITLEGDELGPSVSPS
jgi:hypothetical protein